MRLQGVHNECDGASTRKLKEKSKQRARRQKWTRNQHTEKATACEPDSCEPSSSIGCHRMIHCQAKFHRAAHVRMTVGRTWAWPFGAMGLMIHCEVVTPLFLLDRKRVNTRIDRNFGLGSVRFGEKLTSRECHALTAVLSARSRVTVSRATIIGELCPHVHEEYELVTVYTHWPKKSSWESPLHTPLAGLHNKNQKAPQSCVQVPSV
jgi:hypothetical protein